MKIKTDSPTSVPSHTLGIDLGDKRHAVCVLDHKTGEILEEFSLANSRAQLDKLALRFPDARIAMEVGTHSPWISRLFQKSGLEVIVANFAPSTAMIARVINSTPACSRAWPALMSPCCQSQGARLHFQQLLSSSVKIVRRPRRVLPQRNHESRP
jgi:hypothetical protein